MIRQERRAYRPAKAVSAGGVVYRRSDDGVEVVICGRREDGVWGLPKGTPEDGETLEQTARREVQEETGLAVAIEHPLGTIQYEFNRPEEAVRYHKTVHHYLMHPTGGDVRQHDREYDRVRWVPAGEALRLLTFRNEKAVVRRALERLETKG